MATNILTRYLRDMAFESTHVASGAKVVTDAPTEQGVEKQSFSPGELAGTALASCASSMLAFYALKNNIDLAGLTAETDVQYDTQSAIEKITITFNMPKQEYTEKDKKIFAQYAKNCPVGKMLREDLQKELLFNWPR